MIKLDCRRTFIVFAPADAVMLQYYKSLTHYYSVIMLPSRASNVAPSVKVS